MLAKKCLLVGIFILFSVSLAIADPPAVHPVTGEELVIDCLRGTPDAIDGDLSDWNLEAMTPAVLDAVEQLSSGQASWDNVGDCGGAFYMLWDDENIYIAAVVTDDKLSMNKTDGSIWNADCIEVLFSTLNAVAGHDEHYQYGFNANNQTWNWCNMAGPGQSAVDYLQAASSITADGYICEVSILHSEITPLDWSVGSIIGFHPCIDDTDIDNGDTEFQMSWTGRGAHDQSLGFGHMILSADSAPEPEDPNPVGWWPLNDGAGDIAVDVSGRGNDGAISNPNGGLGLDGSVWVDDPVRGTVISFNGTADGAFVRAGDIPQMTLTNNFTWAFWAKHSDENTADNDIILGNRMDENAADFVPRQFIKFTPTKFEWHMNGNGDDNLDYDDIVADVWLHHAVVKAADQLTYYRNGIEASSGTFTQPLDFPQPLYFGGDNEGSEGENWAGLMSDVRMYNRALTELEIVAAAEDVERVDMEIGFATPVIDGEVDYAWEGASTQYFVPLDDPANASGGWKALYDSENLYVIVDITDDSLVNDSASSWQDDSVEIYFDGGNTKVDTPLSGDDHQYTLAWTTDEIQGTNIDGYTEGIEHAQVDTDTGWRIEIKLPWLSIQGAAPQARDLIGIDCYYNDDDDGGDSRENKLLSFSTVEGWNDASQWGTAVLGVIPEPVDPGTDGLVAFYALDGDANDTSGNELHGTLVGDATLSEGPAGYGMALELDGDGDYVDGGSPPELVITEAISIACWVNPTAFVGRQGFAGLDLGYVLKVHEEGRLCFTTPGIADHESSNTILEAGTWQHVAATFLPGQDEGLVFYLNGVETERMTSSAINPGSGPFRIGNNQWNEQLTGMIDEVAIYNRALSEGEVMYLAGERAVDPSLVIYYSFDEVGEAVADQSGKGHDGVVVGDVMAEANGMYGGAASFSSGGYLDLDGPSIPAEDIPTSAMTLAAWINIANTGGDHEIFSARASDESWLIHPEPKSSGDIRWLLRSYGGTTIFQIRAGTVTWDQWLHFAGTYDKESGNAALYINGELIEELVVENPADIAGDWGLGARVGLTIDDARPFTGLMDEFRMYTRALSQDEILEIMQGM